MCTFTNEKQATITIVKDMVGGTDSFTFTGAVAGTITTDMGSLTSAPLLPGAYTVTEGALPAGWVLTDITDTGACSADLAGAKVTVTLAGSDVMCTFTNTFVQVPNPQITLDPPAQIVGGQVAVAIGPGAFVPNSEITATLFSVPQVVFVGNADSQGGASFVFTVPAGTEAGTHTLVVTDEFGHSVSADVEVIAPPSTSVAGVGVGVGGSTVTPTLAFTGAAPARLLLAALALLSVGLMLTAARRLRWLIAH